MPRYALDDTFLKEKFESIIKEYNITTVVETGINEGYSTLELSKMVQYVIGIDINETAYNTTNARLESNNVTNVELILGNSPDVLKDIVGQLDAEHTIFFLDAHWFDYWPLKDEIRCLPKEKGIIIVHDFVVPNHPEFGYDKYKGQPFTYEFISDVLTEWSPNHRVEYNTQANGSTRGVGFIYPK